MYQNYHICWSKMFAAFCVKVCFLQTAIDVSEWKDVLCHLLIVGAQWRYSQLVLAATLNHISSCGNNNFSECQFSLDSTLQPSDILQFASCHFVLR